MLGPAKPIFLEVCRVLIKKGLRNSRKRAEYCFESTVSEERTHWVLRQTRWVLRETRWVRFGTQILGWEELTEFAPRNSVSPEKLTEFGVWNRTPRNRIRPVSETGTDGPVKGTEGPVNRNRAPFNCTTSLLIAHVPVTVLIVRLLAVHFIGLGRT